MRKTLVIKGSQTITSRQDTISQKDETTVTLKTLALTSSVSREVKTDSDVGNIDLDLSFTYQGKQPSKPVGNAIFKFKAVAKNQYFQKPQNLIAVIDDTSGVVLGSTSYNSTAETSYFIESMSISIPYAAMQRIVQGKTLGFQLGAKAIRLTNDQLTDLRAMAAMMTP